MRAIGLLIAGLVAGAIGAYAGLFVLLAATDLDRPGWAPVAMLIGAAFLSSVAVALLARLPAQAAAGLTTAGIVTGALAGSLVRMVNDSFEWTFAGAALIVAAVVTATRVVERGS